MEKQAVAMPSMRHDVKLRPWQEVVLDEIDIYEHFMDSQSIQALGDFDQNRFSCIQANFRCGAGHTLLTSYLAQKYAAVAVYFNLEHYKELEILGEVGKGMNSFHEASKFISVFELRHEIVFSTKSPGGGRLVELKARFQGKELVVVDGATEVKEKYPEVIEFIFQITSNTPIVLLG